ncbi:hypothetical protein [Trinickia symbiotica]|uniref:Zona occludens toxin N-terminal domain-containing protein n=1 Tax=Trinickia symbiotica TaxID=863227 RepID=A0A2N7X9M9_9BURK|nr:hypothetical protein [Trinickia symbiotica]PMS38453.1 hypothetical protein C0Z20_00780 [Trinickia symbiotica]
MSAGIHNSADIIGVVGASSMGKGIFVKGYLRKLPRRRPIVVWSPLEETDDYAAVIGGERVTSVAALVAAIKAGKTRLVFVPSENEKELKAQFDRFCRTVWHLAGWCVVVEELSNVTMASWAPPAWKKISTAGRHKGLTVIGTSQRPAHVDKDFFGNCTEIRCYRMGYKADAVAMADVMILDYRELLKLDQFHYVHRDKATKTNTPGVLNPPQR